MADKRKHKRMRRRLRINYGEKDFSKSGFTGDLSEGGLFIVASVLEPLDTRLHLQLILDAKTTAFFEGVVTWQKSVPVDLRTIERHGFGVRFLPPSEFLAALLQEKTDGPLIVRYETVAALQRAYQAELRMGGVFIATTRVLPRDAAVSVVFALPFISRTVAFKATVLHAHDAQSPGMQGVAVAFVDPSEVARAFQPLLRKST